MLHFTGSSEVDDNGFDLCEEIETIRTFLAPGQHGSDAMTCSLSKLTEAGDQLWPDCVNAGSKTLLRLRAQFGIPIFGNQSIFTADGNNYQMPLTTTTRSKSSGSTSYDTFVERAP